MPESVLRRLQTWLPEYIVGDSHFDTDATHEMLEKEFGIHPIFPLPASKPLGRQHAWHENQGLPT